MNRRFSKSGTVPLPVRMAFHSPERSYGARRLRAFGNGSRYVFEEMLLGLAELTTQLTILYGPLVRFLGRALYTVVSYPPLVRWTFLFAAFLFFTCY